MVTPKYQRGSLLCGILTELVGRTRDGNNESGNISRANKLNLNDNTSAHRPTG